MKRLKQQLSTLGGKIDALSLRERVMAFAAAACSLVFLVYYTMLNPLFDKQKALRAQIRQEQNNALGIDIEIEQAARGFVVDPDAVERTRLLAVNAEVEQIADALRAMQKGLVAPEKIVALLETILHGNGKLHLLSMKTLPVSGLSEGAFELQHEAKAPLKESLEEHVRKITASAAVAREAESKPPAKAEAAAAPAVKPPELLYRHGVEIALQGSYPDMVAYMEALEAMPSQLFWAQAKLDVEEYPRARLTLVLYTLSLDQTWIAL